MATPLLDHIIILLPYALLLDPPKYLTNQFTISPGGRHGDNKTENRLIIFADGSYIELIAFIDDDPAHREGHWWGDKGYGIIDFAFTLKEGADAFSYFQEMLRELDIPDSWKPQDLRSGSRTKPDGEKIEWKVAFPQASARGRAPFWCFDVTPRERRVSADEKYLRHPSGAKGVGDLMIYLQSEDFAMFQRMMDALLPQTEERMDDTTWTLKTVTRVSENLGAQICLMEAKAEYERTALAKGRRLVARLSILADDKIGGGDVRRVRENIEGDQLLIGFVGE